MKNKEAQPNPLGYAPLESFIHALLEELRDATSHFPLVPEARSYANRVTRILEWCDEVLHAFASPDANVEQEIAERLLEQMSTHLFQAVSQIQPSSQNAASCLKIYCTRRRPRRPLGPLA